MLFFAQWPICSLPNINCSWEIKSTLVLIIIISISVWNLNFENKAPLLYCTFYFLWRSKYLFLYSFLYSVRGLERNELGGSHGCPGRLWDRFLWQVYQNDSRHNAWTEYRPVIKIGPKGDLVSHEIRPIHSAPSLGQSVTPMKYIVWMTETKSSKVSPYVRSKKSHTIEPDIIYKLIFNIYLFI